MDQFSVQLIVLVLSRFKLAKYIEGHKDLFVCLIPNQGLCIKKDFKYQFVVASVVDQICISMMSSRKFNLI